MKKLLFVVLTLGNVVLFAPPKNKGFKSAVAAPSSSVSMAINVLASAASSSLAQDNTSLQQDALIQDALSSASFLNDIDNTDNARLQAPPPSPRAKNQDDNDFDTTAEDDESAAKKIIPSKGYLDELWQLCAITARRKHVLTETIQQKFGLVSEYDKLHNLAIQQKLEDHLNTLNLHDAGAGARFIDTAINTAIKDNNEPILKQILLDIESISTSSLSQDTKQRISTFVIECSHKRKRAITDVVATYLQECDQDASLVRKFTDSQLADEKRHSLADIMTTTREKIEELTRHYSKDTLLVQRK